jgi:hypothetical protein
MIFDFAILWESHTVLAHLENNIVPEDDNLLCAVLNSARVAGKDCIWNIFCDAFY